MVRRSMLWRPQGGDTIMVLATNPSETLDVIVHVVELVGLPIVGFLAKTVWGSLKSTMSEATETVKVFTESMTRTVNEIKEDHQAFQLETTNRLTRIETKVNGT